MSYQILKPLPNEKGITSEDGIFFHTPSEFAKKNLYYPHFGGVYTCTFPYRVSRDYYNSFLLIRIMGGEGLHVRYNEKHKLAAAGTIIFMDCKKKHAYWAEKAVNFQWLHFDGCSSQAYFNLLEPLHGIYFFEKAEAYYPFDSLIEELKNHNRKDHKLSSLIHNILSALATDENNGTPSPINIAVKYMEKNYMKNISIEEIAEYVELNPQYFSRLFKKSTGISPYKYLTRIRLRHAKSLLIESSSFTIREIALNSGFSSSQHFIRLFKQDNLITPNMFRKYFDPTGFRY